MITQTDNQILYHEISEHISKDINPSIYMNEIVKQKKFQEFPFKLLLKLKKTEQSLKYHPEGSVWNHTMLVLDEAAQVREQCKDPDVFMWAALLHDIGKPDTTRNRNGKITSYNHDKVGADLSKKFLREFTEDEVKIEKISDLVFFHMHMLYIIKDLKFADTKNLLNKVDIEDLSLLCRCDRMGRHGVDREEEEKNYILFQKKLNEIKN